MILLICVMVIEFITLIIVGVQFLVKGFGALKLGDKIDPPAKGGNRGTGYWNCWVIHRSGTHEDNGSAGNL